MSGFIISVLWLLIPFAQLFEFMALLSFIFGVCYGLFEVILNVTSDLFREKV